MISTDCKANVDQRDKNSAEIAPAAKAIWHRPKLRVFDLGNVRQEDEHHSLKYFR